ncbi:MAG TPA: hypothetical protein VGJ95_12480 [Pseudonocardiaceae bacterium]
MTADNGRAALAEQWLTAALESVLERFKALLVFGTSEASAGCAELSFALMTAREQVRHELGLPPDAGDDLANSLQNNLTAVESDERVATFWPRGEFECMLERWPALREEDATWDDHRAKVERTLVHFRESEVAPAVVVAA